VHSCSVQHDKRITPRQLASTVLCNDCVAVLLLLLLLLLLRGPHLHLSPSEHSLVRKRAGCMWYSNTLRDWGHASPRGQMPCKSTATCFSVHVAHSSHDRLKEALPA
jgi:hypothetical protein